MANPRTTRLALAGLDLASSSAIMPTTPVRRADLLTVEALAQLQPAVVPIDPDAPSVRPPSPGPDGDR